MNTEELETRLRSLDDRLRIIEDMQEIKKLQRIYAYYLDYSMWEEFADLFSDNTETIEIGQAGVFLGKAGVEKMCKFLAATRVPKEASPGEKLHEMVLPRGFFHAMMIVQPVIDVDAGGKVAYGRWELLESATRQCDGAWTQYWGGGIYENEYIKENGRWSFKNFRFYLTWKTPYHENGRSNRQLKYSTAQPTLRPDMPSTGYHPYPEFYAVPFHYKHPLTGKNTPLQGNRYGERPGNQNVDQKTKGGQK